MHLFVLWKKKSIKQLIKYLVYMNVNQTKIMIDFTFKSFLFDSNLSEILIYISFFLTE